MLWALPSSLPGLLAAVLHRGIWQVHDGALVRFAARGPVSALLGRAGYRAITLGQVVLVRGTPSRGLLAHEQLHVRQAERLGPAFGLLYLLLRMSYGYRAHPLERAARAAAADAVARGEPQAVEDMGVAAGPFTQRRGRR